MFVTRNVFLKYQNAADGNGNDLPGETGNKPEGEKPEGEKPEGEKPEGEKPEGSRKPTDEEARLIKENMKRKATEKALKEELEALKQSVAGLDLTEVRALLAERRTAEEKQKLYKESRRHTAAALGLQH